MRTILQRLLENYTRLSPEASPYERVVVLMSLLIPVVCSGLVLIGLLLIWRRNRWGYYITLVGALGIAVIFFFFND